MGEYSSWVLVFSADAVVCHCEQMTGNIIFHARSDDLQHAKGMCSLLENTSDKRPVIPHLGTPRLLRSSDTYLTSCLTLWPTPQA